MSIFVKHLVTVTTPICGRKWLLAVLQGLIDKYTLWIVCIHALIVPIVATLLHKIVVHLLLKNWSNQVKLCFLSFDVNWRLYKVHSLSALIWVVRLFWFARHLSMTELCLCKALIPHGCVIRWTDLSSGSRRHGVRSLPHGNFVCLSFARWCFLVDISGALQGDRLCAAARQLVSHRRVLR